MGLEIERKFLIGSDAWRQSAQPGVRMRQGYFRRGGDGETVRVRIAGDRAFLTIKGPRRSERCRSEFEYEIPVADAAELLEQFCGGRTVEKIRCIVPVGGREWEVDEYFGDNAGLFTAELELEREDDNGFARPEWLGAEVTADPRYTNGALSAIPWCKWKKS